MSPLMTEDMNDLEALRKVAEEAINLRPDPCEAYLWKRSERAVREVQGIGATPAHALLLALLKSLAVEGGS